MSEEKLLSTLKTIFKHDKFKTEVQENSIREIAKRDTDVIVSMPTGSGKSLCYQLPAVLYDDKVALIFSPLLALIKDQIDHLLALKIKACTLNSKMSKKDREAVIENLKTICDIKLLYITPEQAVTKTFRELYIHLLKNKKVSYLVVDEAHCISQWGHDFRPDYMKLSELRMDDSVPCIALTATAGPEVIKDIKTNLKLRKDCEMYKVSCFRKNLFYDVVYRNLLDNPYDHLCKFIKKCLNNENEETLPKSEKSCGIIYCRTRQQTEDVAIKLTQLGIHSYCYHSGLNNKERLERQEKWQSGHYPVICATISFGMGVDKATVRFVVHWGVPKDPASYYQESGRAGRDNKRSFCRIYYDRSDQKAIEFHLRQDLAKATLGSKSRQTKAEHAIQSFTKIVEYCETARFCRHRLFTDHFGDKLSSCKKNCDMCTDKATVEKQAELFLQNCIQFSTKASTDYNDYSDLYEGGRSGMSSQGYDDDDGDSYDREKRAKKETEDLLRKQFALRRASKSSESSSDSKQSTINSIVKAAEATTVKVTGLTVPAREFNVRMLSEVLELNYNDCKPDLFHYQFEKNDFEDCAVNLEYEIFTSKTNMTMYRSAIAKLIAQIKRNTQSKSFFEALSEHTPQPRQNKTLKDMFYNIKKQTDEKYGIKRKHDEDHGFQSAKQMLENRMKKTKPIDKSQSTLDNFFKGNNIKKEENNDSDNNEENNTNKEITNLSEEEKYTDTKPYSPADEILNEDKEEPYNIEDEYREEEEIRSLEPSNVPDVSDFMKQFTNKINVNENYDDIRSREEEILIKKPNKTHKKSIREELDEIHKNNMEKLEGKSETNKIAKGDKQKIGQFIVQLLMPAYSQNKFKSRDVFKSVARKITHDVMNKDLADEGNIKVYVREFVKKHKIFKDAAHVEI